MSNRYREDVARIIESIDEHEGFVHEMGAKRMDFQVESMLTSSNRDRSMKEPDFDPVARRREFREYFARSCESHHKIALV